jgi:hypothetical protein
MRWCALLVAGCAASAGGGAATFRVDYPDAASAHTKVGAHVYAKPSARCVRDDGSEGRWAITGAHVVSGELPAGVKIEDGAITGKPTAAGDHHATIVLDGVTCNGKPYADQRVDVHITVAPR